MNIFLDVGGNIGQTINEALQPRYRFDVVHSFEPQSVCYEELKRKFEHNPKVVLHNVGLADFDGERDLFGGESSNFGASLFADKKDIDNREVEKCRFIRASQFVTENLKDDDFVALKMNCEGGEALILRDLMRSGAIHSIDTAYIDFDIRKIPSQQDEEQKLIAEMHACGFHNYVLSQELCSVKTYSASKRRMVARNICTREFPSIRLWLASVRAEGYRLTLADKMMRIVPKAIWGRMFRVYRKLWKLFN